MKIIKIEQEDDYLIVWNDEDPETGVHVKLDDFNNKSQFKKQVKDKFDDVKVKKEKKQKYKDKKKDYEKYIGDDL